ncbi:ATP-dependent zinc protease [bacterium]|nr:ATP-dependent zinc protease [bacterium]
MASRETSRSLVIGWREWLELPDLGIRRVKAKIDTGARSSSLHAFDVRPFERDGKQFVRFRVHPLQRNNRQSVEAEAEVLEYRKVKSSNGQTSKRPVILTTVEALGEVWQIELTLANRDEMGFRMLLGREAVRGRFLVDAGSSFYGGGPKRKKTKLKRKRAT